MKKQGAGIKWTLPAKICEDVHVVLLLKDIQEMKKPFENASRSLRMLDKRRLNTFKESMDAG